MLLCRLLPSHFCSYGSSASGWSTEHRDIQLCHMIEIHSFFWCAGATQLSNAGFLRRCINVRHLIAGLGSPYGLPMLAIAEHVTRTNSESSATTKFSASIPERLAYIQVTVSAYDYHKPQFPVRLFGNQKLHSPDTLRRYRLAGFARSGGAALCKQQIL